MDNKKIIVTTIFLMALLFSSVYASFLPKAQAAEVSLSQKGLVAIQEVSNFDLTKYTVTWVESNQDLAPIGPLSHETILYNLNSTTGSIEMLCTFANGSFQGLNMFDIEGTQSLKKQTVCTTTVASAQNFLGSYQLSTNRPLFGELKASLNDIPSGQNLTKIVGDKTLQVTDYGKETTTYKWYYTVNGAISPYTKFVSLGFKDGLITTFLDNWDLYNIGSTNINLSKEEAVSIALDTARNHNWSMPLDKDTLDSQNLNEKRSVSWAVLNYDNSLNANNTRGTDPLALYPVWRIGLSLNKAYGILFGIEVDIWADTKELRVVNEQYSDFMAQVLDNATSYSTGTSVTKNDDSVSNSLAGSGLVLVLISATIAASAVTITIFARRKSVIPKRVSLPLRKLRFLVSLLLVLIICSSMIEATSATNAGITWGATSTGSPNPGYGHSWRKTNDEVTLQPQIAYYIAYSCFTPANGYYGIDGEAENKGTIVSQAINLNNNYDYVAVVDFDHGVGGYPNQGDPFAYPNVDYSEEHYMFEDDWGTVVGTPAYHYNDYSHGVYDIDMYNAFSPSKVHFAFINTCQSANLWRLGSGINSNGNPIGLPFAFTHRIVGGAPIGTQMSDDGYDSPDAFPQCYIGFPTGSAALAQQIDYNGQWNSGPYWFDWVYDFFTLALNYDCCVKGALDTTSWLNWGCQGLWDSPLRGNGFTAVWPCDYDGDGDWETGYWQIGYNGLLNVYGNSNIHLKNFQPSDYVTAPLTGGPISGEAGVSYEYFASAIDDKGHNVRYKFDWGDGNITETAQWYANGDAEVLTHSWSSDGVYEVRVQACCSNGQWSAWSNAITMNIAAYHWVTVNAYDAYLGENYPLSPVVYIDGDPVGTAPVSVYLTRADEHTIVLDYTTYNPYFYSDAQIVDVTGNYYGWYWLDSNYLTVHVLPYYDSTVNVWYRCW